MKILVDERFAHERSNDSGYLEAARSLYQVMAELGMHYNTVRNYLRRGYFPHAYRTTLARNAPVMIPVCCINKFKARVADLSVICQTKAGD